MRWLRQPTGLPSCDDYKGAGNNQTRQNPSTQTGHDAQPAHRKNSTAMKTPGNAKPQLGTTNNQTIESAKAELGLGAPTQAGAPKGWYSRGYLPHLDVPGILQFITFRLADSLPQSVLKQLEQELEQLPISMRERERRKKIEQWLDAGLGCCALRHSQHGGSDAANLAEYLMVSVIV